MTRRRPPAGEDGRTPPAPTMAEQALAEYKQLKTEQAGRIGTRDNLIYVTLVAIAGTLTITVTAHDAGYLLLVPPVATLLGWTYLMNDQKISAIGRCLREHPALTGMRWEREHTADGRHRSRKLIQLAADLGTFCGSAAAALAVAWTRPEAPALYAVSAAEAIITGALACQFALYAGLFRRNQNQ
jgi:hypothetical protein